MSSRTILWATGGGLVLLALVIGLVPMFTDCQSQGRALTLPGGATVPMKCHWTGVAELALAVPLLALGFVTGFTRRREGRRALSIVGIAMGALVILIPTTLIGVCAADDMLCNMIMRPTLALAGTLVIALSTLSYFLPETMPENSAEAFA